MVMPSKQKSQMKVSSSVSLESTPSEMTDNNEKEYAIISNTTCLYFYAKEVKNYFNTSLYNHNCYIIFDESVVIKDQN